MAYIDKIYGTREQRRELKRFIRRSRLPGHVRRAFYRNFYAVGSPVVCNLPTRLDRVLWRLPGLPAWVRERLVEQYGAEGPGGER